MGLTSLQSQVTSGIAWSGAARVLQQITQFGFSVLMARLLSPDNYGLMAMVLVFTGFAGMLADAGLSTALVQKQDLNEVDVHTIFWVTLGSSVLLTGATCLLAPWLAAFYHVPSLSTIFRIISINFIIGGIGNVPSALLLKRMEFQTIAKIDTVAMLFSGILSVALALAGGGVWSLVAQMIASTLIASILRCWACRWLPKTTWSWSALKNIWGFSGHLYAFNFMNYWSRNADNLVVGRFFGASELGAYNRAYSLMILPISQINGVISQVIFPAFSNIGNDKDRVKRIYLRAMGIVALLGFPLMIGLLVVAEPFILTIYGNKWSAAIALLQILAAVGILQIVGNSTGWLFLSQGRTDLLFGWGIAYSVAAVLSFLAGTYLGSVKAVALCYAFVNVLFFYPELDAATRTVGLRGMKVISTITGPLLSSLTMGAVVTLVRIALPADWASWKRLTTLSLSGAVLYFTLVTLFRLSSWHDLLKVIREKIYGGDNEIESAPIT